MNGLHSFVIRGGRVTDAQRRSYEELTPKYCVPAEGGTIDFPTLFGNTNPVTIEIGFGMGTATAQIAEANPDRNYLGFEVFKAGIGRLMWEAEHRDLHNIRIIEGDAQELIAGRVAPSSVAAFHIFFPDPWPKKRHWKRRLITRPFTDTLAERLIKAAEGQPAPYLYMATDWADYGDWALRELAATPGLVNHYADAGLGGFAPHQEWRPETKFESKGLKAGHAIRELYFIKA